MLVYMSRDLTSNWSFAMTDLPLVSIVLAVFNGERFLREQLDSLVSQTYANIEIIAVDDASTDGSPLILKEFSRRHSNIVVDVSPENGGQIAALERGLGLARGDYIAISDQDDIWLPEKISKLLDCIQRSAAVFSDSALIDENGNSLNKSLIKDFVRINPVVVLNDPIALVAKNTTSGHAVLFRRELLRVLLPFSKEIMYDQQIAITSVAAGGLRYLDEPLVLHRQHSGNTTNKLVDKGTFARTKDRSIVRRVGKAKAFYRALKFTMSICLREDIRRTLNDDGIYVQAAKLEGWLGKPGLAAVFGRLSFLLRYRSRLFHSVGAIKGIQKSWRLAVDGCYE
ncbi:MAG: glycosyltransferase [Spongiibacteraceae bacterium]